MQESACVANPCDFLFHHSSRMPTNPTQPMLPCRLHARRIKRYLEDGGASYAPSSDASAEPASEPLPPTTGNVPLTSAVAALDAPDLGNLRVQSGTFQRWPVAAEAPAMGVPVPEQVQQRGEGRVG
eukprot:283171-Chlamydomonas_euryale.AAC.1